MPNQPRQRGTFCFAALKTQNVPLLGGFKHPMKRIALFILVLLSGSAFASRPFYESISGEQLFAGASRIVLGQLMAGSYEVSKDSYAVALQTTHTIKGKETKEFQLQHSHGWNRLDKLGGYYIVFLGKDGELIKTGSSIIPTIHFGGPFSDMTMPEAAAYYELPRESWFVLDNRLWALGNCIPFETETCSREKTLVQIMFNKANHGDS